MNIRDIVNPPGMFSDGKRQSQCENEWALPASGRLLPEFDIDKRRSIKDMFARRSANVSAELVERAATPPSTCKTGATEPMVMHTSLSPSDSNKKATALMTEENRIPQSVSRKRPQPLPTTFAKRSKSTISTPSGVSESGQKTLMGFFKPKPVDICEATRFPVVSPGSKTLLNCNPSEPLRDQGNAPGISLQSQKPLTGSSMSRESNSSIETPAASKSIDNDTIIDPIVSKDDWSKLFNKKSVPPCDGHQEPCIGLTTKKPGMNFGRSFWICPRPLGPSGNKEQGTQWRCPTFIWASDWKSSATTHGQ